ncbi:hypothetical protein MCG98_07810 [Ruminococcus sp. OA3]|uniref:hypothetical protein n=1 Tax=Ruminococcus sp. OA3 TaxID=2914164 RepID=UPI001F05CC3D|nr:hypothetical protein [Ruminococcus sp. OA3]MCH1982469.1 hypothetical protein [Ruminococcus sp. OA3]
MKKSNVFEDNGQIICSVCGKKVMDNPEEALLNIISNRENKMVSIAGCCKGKCDSIVSAGAPKGCLAGWKDIINFTNPYLYIKHIMSVFNSMADGKGFENRKAFEEYKRFLLLMYPYVTRDMTDQETHKAQIDDMLPF